MNQRNVTYFLRVSLIVLLAPFLLSTGCAKVSKFFPRSSSTPTDVDTFVLEERFAPSGTIVLSRQLPDLLEVASIEEKHSSTMAPLIGYVPPSSAFLPADNETWLEINRETLLVSLHKGKEVIQAVQGEGKIALKPGIYPLQQKQKSPVWYASDEYFTKRALPVPKEEEARYLRGALGPYALYLDTTFPIHSSAVWSDEVGGVRISRMELSAIYDQLPIGTSVVVK